MAKIGTPLLDSGSMKESSTAVCENGNGPSSLKQIQWHSELRLAGSLSAGHTIDSSSAVRVTEEKTPFVAQFGTVAAGSMRTMAYAQGSQRNLSCRRPGSWGFSPSSRATGIFLSSFMTLRDRARLHRRAGYPPSNVQSSTALRNAARAKMHVESSVGSGAASGDRSSGTSVQPRIRASQP